MFKYGCKPMIISADIEQYCPVYKAKASYTMYTNMTSHMLCSLGWYAPDTLAHVSVIQGTSDAVKPHFLCGGIFSSSLLFASLHVIPYLNRKKQIQ